MLLRPLEERAGNGLPRLHHWVVAAAMLIATTLVVPVLAGLT